MAEAEEVGGSALDVPWNMAQDRSAQGAGLADKRVRADEIAQTQAGKKRFGEAAHIDDTAIAIERFECR